MTDTRAYYNEFEPYCAQWLRNLIDAGLLPPGDVDDRSIEDVRADDLRGYTQCHFFAGLGGWGHALRLAGWPDDRPIWTGSPPCQPFSAAGKRGGFADRRDLWPHFYGLIHAVRPPVVMGEQVDAAVRYGWLDRARIDLEASGYTCRAAIVPACSVNAPHKRGRLWFVADSKRGGYSQALRVASEQDGNGAGERVSVGDCGMADTTSERRDTERGAGETVFQPGQEQRSAGCGSRSILADTSGAGLEGRWLLSERACERPAGQDGMGSAECYGSFTVPQLNGTQEKRGMLEFEGSGFWDESIWIECGDDKQRRVKPGVRLLADGVPARVGKLRALGNAIVPQVAAEVVRAYMEAA